MQVKERVWIFSMKTDAVALKYNTNSLEAILEQAEKVAEYYKLPARKALQLRLLCEEVSNMIPELLYFSEGSFYIDGENKNVEIHVNLKAVKRMDMDKDRILSVSADKKNSAKGIINGILNAVSSFLEGQEAAEQSPAFLDMMSLDTYPGAYWSLDNYMETEEYTNSEEPWDELEKSIILGVADDVKVGIVDKKVDIVIKKDFN